MLTGRRRPSKEVTTTRLDLIVITETGRLAVVFKHISIRTVCDSVFHAIQRNNKEKNRPTITGRSGPFTSQ